MPAQAQQTLAMLAKGIERQIHPAPVRPTNFVTHKSNTAALTVSAGIPPKQDGQNSRLQMTVHRPVQNFGCGAHRSRNPDSDRYKFQSPRDFGLLMAVLLSVQTNRRSSSPRPMKYRPR
jgi:hypothetical protein